jgi:hypothetical protein
MLNVPRRAPAPVINEGPAETPAPAEQAATVGKAADDPMLIKLTQPIRSHQGTLYELRLREPRAADYIEVGKVPFDVRGDDDNRRATVDFKAASQWAARLTDLDEILVGQLSSRDWLTLVSRINTILLSNIGDDVGN